MLIKKVTPQWVYKGAKVYLKTIGELKREFPVMETVESGYSHDKWINSITEQMIPHFGNYVIASDSQPYSGGYTCYNNNFMWDLKSWAKGFIL